MRVLFLHLILFFFTATIAFGQNVGIGTNSPDPSAKLHIEAADGGLLAPRVTLVDITNGTTPVNTPVTGLLVYNNNATVTGGSGTGYYYWDGTKWVKFVTENDNDWNINANGTGLEAAPAANNVASGSHAIAAGEANTASGDYSAISGGQNNMAASDYAAVVGGSGNTAGFYATAGGLGNTASGNYATIVGGQNNNALSNYGTVVGGSANTVALYSIAGGQGNLVNGNYSVAFGRSNNASGLQSTISGGGFNSATNQGTSVGGGAVNHATGSYAVIAGGRTNTASSTNATIAGGWNNDVSGLSATISGGEDNIASGNFSYIAGGENNQSIGVYSSVLGGGLNNATGAYALVLGGGLNVALGEYSMTSGINNTAYSYGEWVGGLNASAYTANSTTAWNANDRLFVIGNGTTTAARSNALTIYKDGRLNINDAYTMPTTAGTAGQVLTTDGAGNASWETRVYTLFAAVFMPATGNYLLDVPWAEITNNGANGSLTINNTDPTYTLKYSYSVDNGAPISGNLVAGGSINITVNFNEVDIKLSRYTSITSRFAHFRGVASSGWLKGFISYDE